MVITNVKRKILITLEISVHLNVHLVTTMVIMVLPNKTFVTNVLMVIPSIGVVSHVMKVMKNLFVKQTNQTTKEVIYHSTLVEQS